MIELPPLPAPEIDYWGDFTADQMRAYGEACATAATYAAHTPAALEEACTVYAMMCGARGNRTVGEVKAALAVLFDKQEVTP